MTMAENAVDRALAAFRAYEKRGVTRVAGVAAPKTPRTFNDLAAVTPATPCAALSVTGVANNNLTKSSGRPSATPVTPATPENKQSQKTANPVSFPLAEALDELQRRCPDHVDPYRWQQAIQDAEAFLAKWRRQAQALGWTADELFGLHPVPAQPAPSYHRLSRYDCTGLIWLLRGRPVVALTDTTATISTPSGGTVTYRKHRKPALGPLGDSLDDMS
jgi:hypothetical protein